MTIAAIATANAVGGIGIVRLSGEKAFNIIGKLFEGCPVEKMKSHTMHLGKIVYNEEVIDEVLVCLFKGPNSYTGEDVAEINCHGGIYVCRKVLEACLSCGAKMAGAGEFTKRAFLNGKMDLSQAEAVADMISAENENQVTIAAKQLDKQLSNEISIIRSKLVDALGHIMVNMDFSEDGVEPISYEEIKHYVDFSLNRINELLASSDNGRIIKYGINVAIVGSPNVGKSSLLNYITGENRAIVTDIAGTTRDVLETEVNINGCKINLFDTAGIHDSKDVIEKIGIERSKDTIKNCEITFFVIDGSVGITKSDEEILNLIDKSKTILIINKSDLNLKEIDKTGYMYSVEISAKNGEGIENLYDYIINNFFKIDLNTNVVITNPRHKDSLFKAKLVLEEVKKGIDNLVPFDLILSDMELCISNLGEIEGSTVSDEIVENIFSKFCVGK